MWQRYKRGYGILCLRNNIAGSQSLRTAEGAETFARGTRSYSPPHERYTDPLHLKRLRETMVLLSKTSTHETESGHFGRDNTTRAEHVLTHFNLAHPSPSPQRYCFPFVSGCDGLNDQLLFGVYVALLVQSFTPDQLFGIAFFAITPLGH